MVRLLAASCSTFSFGLINHYALFVPTGPKMPSLLCERIAAPLLDLHRKTTPVLATTELTDSGVLSKYESFSQTLTFA